MARQFARGSQQYLDRSSISSAPPWSVSAWIYPETLATDGMGVAAIDNTGSSGYFGLRINSSGDAIASQYDGTIEPSARVNGIIVQDVWRHLGAEWASNASRKLVYDGAVQATDTTSASATTGNTLGIGRRQITGSLDLYFNGRIAEVAFWNTTLSADEWAALGKGVSPLFIRPASLQAYYPFLASAAPDVDRWNGRRDLTAYNTPTLAAHCRVYLPWRSSVGLVGTAVAADLAATPSIALTSAAALTATARFAAAAAIALTAAATLSAPGPLLSAPLLTSVVVTGTATLTAPIALAASAAIAFTASAEFSNPLSTDLPISIGMTATIDPSPRATTVVIELDGADITSDARKGLTIRDVLNDAPNTASLIFDGPVPVVSQRVRIAINDGLILLFAGSLQTVDRSYEGGRPALGAWPSTAIDDTARANFRRPFGTFVNESASTVGQSLVADFAPDFADTGIEVGLPTVTITFDGSETFIAAFARLAQLIGGYTKIEDGIAYLFLEDLAAQPDPLDAAHPPLNEPPVRASVDVSQLRSRVYGKGYGENVPSDVAAGETIVPITDGVLFNPDGGQAITATTADGAQHQVIDYGGVVLSEGGTLVGPGAAPSNAPTAALSAGSGVTSGVHNLAVVHVTAAGKSLPGPSASIDVGLLAPPSTAVTPNAAVSGTGPDQGWHDYKLTNVASFGETNSLYVSGGILTNAASGQLTAPGNAFEGYYPTTAGNLDPSQGYRYRSTFINAQGETEGGTVTGGTSGPGLPSAYNQHLTLAASTGGSLTTGHTYRYYATYYCAGGPYETVVAQTDDVVLSGGATKVTVSNILGPPGPDSRVTKRRIYRSNVTTGSTPFLVHETADGSTTASFVDTASDASLSVPHVPGGTAPGFKMFLTSIPTGPPGVTSRKIYRQENFAGDYKLVGTLSNNTATTFDDNTAFGGGGVAAPTSNTTGTAVQVIPITAIPIGPAGTTSRKLYRRFNFAGDFKLVATIANNVATTYNDSTPNSGLGAVLPTTNTAVANQIALTNIPIGAAAVTAREVYMTPAGGGTARRVLTIGDNVTTTGTVTMSDATLAGQLAAPTSDTSGLTQPTGQINPGSTSLPVASSAPFAVGGGWVQLGSQTVRYTGIGGQSLTGIPALGEGAIFTTVLYGQQALPAPALIGVTGLVLPMLRGSAVHIWVQRDDVAAQAEQAARDGGDGVVEFVITDARRGEPSLIERCDAELALFSRPLVTVYYGTRDPKTKSGKQIAIDLSVGGLVIHETLTIQDVTITEIDIAPNLAPRYNVTASSVRFSLEDTLRRLVVA